MEETKVTEETNVTVDNADSEVPVEEEKDVNFLVSFSDDAGSYFLCVDNVTDFIVQTVDSLKLCSKNFAGKRTNTGFIVDKNSEDFKTLYSLIVFICKATLEDPDNKIISNNFYYPLNEVYLPVAAKGLINSRYICFSASDYLREYDYHVPVFPVNKKGEIISSCDFNLNPSNVKKMFSNLYATKKISSVSYATESLFQLMAPISLSTLNDIAFKGKCETDKITKSLPVLSDIAILKDGFYESEDLGARFESVFVNIIRDLS